MWRLLRQLMASKAPARHRAGQDRHVRPRLEVLEGRLAPSALSSGVGGEPIAPERPVHGYKWRPYWPRAVAAVGVTGTMPVVDGVTLSPGATVSLSAEVTHLVRGGAEGGQVEIGAQGHIVVQPPVGPVPLDTLLAGR
jgi:hypothetical protein